MKRDPKSKRLHDSDSGRFLPEDVTDGLTPFGYNDDDSDSGSGLGVLVLILLIVTLIAGYAYATGLWPF